MKDKSSITSPIAIDLGAKNTGVFFAHYQTGSTLSKVGQSTSGKVYCLPNDGKFTYLMKNRTASRHQKRSLDRRQMAKRLFKLIWESLDLPWDDDVDVQKTLSFLLNRRGFTRPDEAYDRDDLRDMPDGAKWQLIKLGLGESDDERGADAILDDLVFGGPDVVKDAYEAIAKKTLPYRKAKDDFKCTQALDRYCSEKTADKTRKQARNRLRRVSKDVFGRWMKDGIIKSSPQDAIKGKALFNVADWLDAGGNARMKTIREAIGASDDLGMAKARMVGIEKTKWGFAPSDFTLNKFHNRTSVDKETEEEVRWHLHHFAFALQNVRNEMESGGRPRNRYFDEVGAVLKNWDIKKPGPVSAFCRKLRDEKKYKHLNEDNLARLIGHISNLELKPLRKYFNDPAHEGKGYWDESRLEGIVANWMFEEWRVKEDDRLKADGAEFSYSKLRMLWKEKPQGVVAFWLDTDPNYTIPPYQNNNNRNIPRCQSLLLNVRYLDDKYPKWGEWLSEMKRQVSEVADFEESLRQRKSNSRKPYFPDSNAKTSAGSRKVRSGKRTSRELDARLLQFILDRTKATDPLNLKQIYQCARSLRKMQKARHDQRPPDEKRLLEVTEKLVKAIEDSHLPASLQDDWNPQSPSAPFSFGSFLHFIYSYYRMRERAEDGRVFIHPLYRPRPERGYERTRKFYDKAHLLTYCNHKPRQKQHQMLGDVASLLQMPPRHLETRVKNIQDASSASDEASRSSSISNSDMLVAWLRKLRGMKTACKKAADELKNRGGRNLALDIRSLWWDAAHVHRGDKTSKKAIKDALRTSTVPDSLSLFELGRQAIDLCNQMVQDLHDGKDGEMTHFTPERAVFVLAQLNSIVFDTRSGFSRTCPVCSEDNAFRGQMMRLAAESEGLRARAQRLPAIPNRVIDGAVRRMARIVSAAIADDKWKEIEGDIKAGKQLRVPIIIESNRFEFDKQVRQWIKTDTSQKGPPERNLFEEKKQRIMKAGHGYCPYTDEKLNERNMDLDHIVPRKSEWGVLNDEANLVGATKGGNAEKGNKRYDLSNLRPKYKKAVFGPLNLDGNKAIEDWIVSTLWDADAGSFRFGNYVNFSSLQQKDQIAFRHALFLSARHDELRDRVINAMNNRMRTLVNGTQRYFAETLVAALYRKAMRIRKESQLSFDYYDIEVKSNSRGRGVRDLRDLYAKHDPILREYDKKDNEKQKDYSHLIDAQLAFVIAADAHRNDGGMGIDIPDDIRVAPTDNDGANSILHYVRVSHEDFEEPTLLERRETSEGFFAHKTLFDSEPRAWHFLKLIEITDGEKSLYMQGFSDLLCLEKCLKETEWADALENSYGRHLDEGNTSSTFLPYGRVVKGREINAAKALYSFDQFGYSRKRDGQAKVLFTHRNIGDRFFTVKLYRIDHGKVAEFLLDKFNTDIAPETVSEADIKTYQMLFDRLYLTKREKINRETIADTMAKIHRKFQFQKLYDPSLIKEWSRVAEVTNGCEDDDLGKVLKKHFSPSGSQVMHEAVKKHFSLPVKSEGQGFMLIKRHSWQGKAIYQLQSEKSGDSGAGLFEKRENEAGAYDSLKHHFRAKSIVLLREWSGMKRFLSTDGALIDRDTWHPLPNSDVDKANEAMAMITENRVEMLENKFISKGDSTYRVKFENPVQDVAPLIGLMKAGLQIDEMKVGNKKTKESIDKWLISFFGKGKGNKQWLSIQDAKGKLEREIDSLIEIQNDKDQPALTELQRTDLERMRKWLQWIGCIRDDKTVVEYKRGVGLKINKG